MKTVVIVKDGPKLIGNLEVIRSWVNHFSRVVEVVERHALACDDRVSEAGGYEVCPFCIALDAARKGFSEDVGRMERSGE